MSMTRKYRNPWEGIDEDSLVKVAKVDKIYFDNLPKKSESKIKNLKLDIYPQHFVGDIENASILILSLNPGYNDEYKELYDKNIDYQNTIKNNLELSNSRFHAFDLSTENNLGYWGEKLKHWIIDKEFKDRNENENNHIIDSLKKLGNNIALAEFFPYHSVSYDNWFDKIPTKVKKDKRDERQYLPTQDFLFNIIRERIKKGDVTIILTRAFKKWYEAIPELENYEQCYEVSNPNNPSLKTNLIFKVKRESVQKNLDNLLLTINQDKH